MSVTHEGDSLAGHAGNCAQILHGWELLTPREQFAATLRLAFRLQAIDVLAEPIFGLADHADGCRQCQDASVGDGFPCDVGSKVMAQVNALTGSTL